MLQIYFTDINKVFDEILFAEDRLVKDGYREGFQKGSTEGNLEGYHLGYHRGAEIGAELGYYLGVALATLNDKDKKLNEKLTVHLQEIIDLINKFPQTNVDDVDIKSELEKVKSLYKKICSLLKLNATYPEIDQLSF